LQKQLKRTKLFFQKAHYHFEGPWGDDSNEDNYADQCGDSNDS
jgi:hypothetical protein